MLNDLLKLRNRGLSLIPVAGKRAADKDGAKRPSIPWQEFQERIATEDEIKKWLELYPNGDIGVVTGPISRIFVLDVDGEEGELSLKGYRIPPTWEVKTKRGRHIYFRWVPALDGKVTTKAAIKPSVDVRGEGGYVVAPPSAGYNGTPYTWKSAPHLTPLAVPPEWLIALLPPKGNSLPAAKQEDKSKQSWLTDALDGLKEGNRNDTFTKVAGSLRARGYDGATIFELLKDKASSVNFSENELRIICNSIGNYPTTESADRQCSSDVESFLHDIETVEWICEPIIAKKTIGFVAGLPETMKTWSLIDFAIECARGKGTWLNRFPVAKARVLFIDQERFKGETQRRFRAVLAAKNVTSKELKDSLFIRCGTTTRINLQSSFDAFKKELAELRPDVVIIDSFATFHTCEENNRKDIQEVLERVKQLRTEFGCTFIFVHHENKFAFHSKEEEREPSIAEMAGSVAIPAAAEFVLTVRKQDAESSFIYHTKSTLAATTQPFLIKVTDTGPDTDPKSKIQVEAF